MLTTTDNHITRSSKQHRLKACDVQISYGLTGQSIATATTNGGSLALGEVQADLLYEDCKGIPLELQSVLQKIIDWTVELNYGKEAKTPQIVFDVEKRATFDQVLKAIENAGFLKDMEEHIFFCNKQCFNPWKTNFLRQKSRQKKANYKEKLLQNPKTTKSDKTIKGILEKINGLKDDRINKKKFEVLKK